MLTRRAGLPERKREVILMIVYSALGAAFSLVRRLTITTAIAAGIRQTREVGKLVIPNRSAQAKREPTIMAARAP